jgi:hypothetical protein
MMKFFGRYTTVGTNEYQLRSVSVPFPVSVIFIYIFNHFAKLYNGLKI